MVAYSGELSEQLNVRTLFHIKDVQLRESVLEEMARGFVGLGVAAAVVVARKSPVRVEASRPAGAGVVAGTASPCCGGEMTRG